MADWILVPCLVKLRSEFNLIAPNRDKSSDGSIGDAAHQLTESDHNDDEVGRVPIQDVDKRHEVHAVDIDVDLREPDLTMEEVVQFLLARCRSGAERRLRYIIFNRRIWEASNGWKQRTYYGKNPHDHHAHFSSSYNTSLEASIAPWELEDLMSLSTADKTWLTGELNKIKSDVAALKTEVVEIQSYFVESRRTDDGTPQSTAGHLASAQGVPNPHVPGEERTTAWEVGRDNGRAILRVEKAVEALASKVLPGS